MEYKEFKLTNLAVNKRTTIYFLTILIVIFGIIQYNATPKEENPEIVFPFFMINTIHPGTSPTDVENLITRPIEKKLKGIDGIKQISSNSIQDFSSVVAEFEMTADEIQAYLDIKQAVDEARSELPDDLLRDPDIRQIDLSEIPILFINLSGDLSLVTLKDYAEYLQDEIEALEEITRVDIAGALDREIQINVDLYKMAAAGISFQKIQGAIAAENLTISSGQLERDGMKKNLRVVGEFDLVSQLGDILLQKGVYLKDIAEVKDGFADRSSYSRLNGSDVITLNVLKKGGENLINAVDKIKNVLSTFQNRASENLLIEMSGDSSDRTRNALSDLFNTMILGFLVVVLVLMFFMGEADALFVGISIPLSMLIAFIVIPLIGFSMNRVVLMAFIMVLGIVVDNSIVVVENIYRHFTTTADLPIIQASKRGVGEVALSVFTGTLTTMAPFFPLIFMPGIAGKFVSFLPITILITLTASMLVAYIINPVFAVTFMKYKGEKKGTINHKRILMIGLGLLVLSIVSFLTGKAAMGNLIMIALVFYLFFKYILKYLIQRFQSLVLPRIIDLYKKFLAVLLKGKRPYLVVFATILFLFLSFNLLRLFPPPVVFFPSGDPNNILVYITMPEGTSVSETNRISRHIEGMVSEVIGESNPDIESVVTNVAVNAGSGLFERSSQEKLAKVTINFVEFKDRTGAKTSTEYLNELRLKLRGIPGAEIEVDREASGPATGKPISVEISGENIETLVIQAEKLKLFINSLGIKGIEHLEADMETSKPELLLTIDREKASELGISTAQIGMLLRTSLFGTQVSTFREGEDEYPIRLRLDDKYRNDVDVLLSQTVAGNDRSQVPLSAIASLDNRTSYGGIIRKDTERVITLSSNVLFGYNANQIIWQIARALPNFPAPDGYRIQFTGEQEMQKEVADYLGLALLIAVAMIFIILVGQFDSLGKPAIIICQIIFSFSGVLLGFIIFGFTISVIMTGMGIIAVAGIVVKNVIIIIDYTDKRFAREGKNLNSIIEASATRLTPVLLTALSTILGLTPLAIGMNINFISLITKLNPQIYFGGDNAVFWNPLAWTIIFGLAFATFLTLIVVPAMYKLFFLRKAKEAV